MAGAIRKIGAHGHAIGKNLPPVVPEILAGITLGLAGGFLWKMQHWNLKRRTHDFYDDLSKGTITVNKD